MGRAMGKVVTSRGLVEHSVVERQQRHIDDEGPSVLCQPAGYSRSSRTSDLYS